MQEVQEQLLRLIKEIEYKEVENLFESLEGGKRLRAKLVLKIAKQSKDASLLAAIIELIHAASLLHDDVIDDADMRRGVPSVNATKGSKTAVMLGDILYSKAFVELTSFDPEIARSVARSVVELSKGEMMDVNMSEQFNSDESLYMQMLYFKTATLIEAACKASAILAKKDPAPFALFGKNLGLSFQIIDDILDITSDSTTLGKPAFNDYVEGKVTLPYIYLYYSLDSSDKTKLVSLFKKQMSEDEKRWLLEQFDKHGAIDRAYSVARKLTDEAKEVVSDEIELVEILEKMIKRSH